MAFSLISNLSSLESQSKLNTTGASLNKTIQRLSSGLRINSSADDAAGLAIANKFRSDISILSQGVRNANDGLSTLQIVDGGLNTISSLLDRAGTLASQSASDTFNGNRETLQGEFSKILSEVTRQAQAVGLVQGGTNNRTLTTIIGGGSDSFAAVNTNNGVQIDLSGTSNHVDAIGLGLGTSNIGASSGTATAAGGINFSTPGTTITAAETLSFQYVGATGSLATTTVSLTAGQSANSVLSQLQTDAGLQAAGIKAGLDASGNLQFSSANFFTAASSLAAASQTGIGTAIKTTGAANTSQITATAATAAASQDLTFSYVSNGAVVNRTLSVATSTTAATGATSLETAINGNSTLREAGIFAVRNGAVVDIVSTKTTSFSVNRANAGTGGAANNSFGAGVQNSTAGTATGGAQGAKIALDSIKSAIATLGNVQGRVGAGQNRLQQAIDLATSQVTNFQAAESRIREADVSSEASNLSRLTVLQQAGVAALAQANQSTQAVLLLLR